MPSIAMARAEAERTAPESPAGDPSKLTVENVTKVHGPRPERVLDELRAGTVDKKALSARTGHVLAVDDVSLSVPVGSVYVLMGLSGSGKSTLLRCMNRLNKPTAGRILLDGEDIASANSARLRDIRRRRISMVFQDYALLPNRTVLNNILFGLEIRGVSRPEGREKALRMLELVGLAGCENRYPAELSGGMQQRTGLARALVGEPDVLLLDEPFSGLDPLTRKQMQQELLRIQATVQRTLVFVTHDLDEALTVGDNIGIMSGGRLIQTGTAQSVFQEPANDHVAEFVRDISPLKVLTAHQVMSPAHESDLSSTPDLEPRIRSSALLEEVVALLADTDADAVAVVDRNDVVVGRVTNTTVVKALHHKPIHTSGSER